MNKYSFIHLVASMLLGIIFIAFESGCSSEGKDDGLDSRGTDSSGNTDTFGEIDSGEDSALDSATTNDSDSAPMGNLLHLEGIPNFRIGLPSSLSKAVYQTKAVTPKELDEVQSEGFYQLQEERIFSEEIYQIRGLVRFLEEYTLENAVPEDTVVELGLQTGVLYEGGPSDGEAINPHMFDVDSQYEGVDLGRMRWWSVGDGITVVWHIRDDFFASFPFWQIEIFPSDVDTEKRIYTVTTFRPQWDGVQENNTIRYVQFDEGKNETKLFLKNVGFSMTDGADIDYVYVAFQNVLAKPEQYVDTDILEDTDTTKDTSDTDNILDTNSVTTIGVGTDLNDSDSSTEEPLLSSGTDEPTVENTLLYKETGVIDATTLSSQSNSRIVAVGNAEGGGIVASIVPFEIWNDDGSFVDYKYYYKELYSGTGNLISRHYAKKYNGDSELSEFSWFIPDLEATNFYPISTAKAPPVIYYLYQFDNVSALSTFAYSLDSPEIGAWTSLTQEESTHRVIWKQQVEVGSAWATGDVVYEYSSEEIEDCSVAGETSCFIYSYRPHAIYPSQVTVFDEPFYPEQQWPIRYLVAADSASQIKIETMDAWPFVESWIEDDNNDVRDEFDAQLNCHLFDVYFYTQNGELVDSTVPMMYSTQGTLPDNVVVNTVVAQTAIQSEKAVEAALTTYAPDQTVPFALELLSEDDFLSLFETTETDTDNLYSTDTDSAELSLDTETAADSELSLGTL